MEVVSSRFDEKRPGPRGRVRVAFLLGRRLLAAAAGPGRDARAGAGGGKVGALPGAGHADLHAGGSLGPGVGPEPRSAMVRSAEERLRLPLNPSLEINDTHPPEARALARRLGALDICARLATCSPPHRLARKASGWNI